MVRLDLRNETGVKETRIEELVATMRKQELANKVQNYSDYVVNDLKGKSFDSFVDEDVDLKDKMIDPDVIEALVVGRVYEREEDLMARFDDEDSEDLEGLNEDDYEKSLVNLIIAATTISDDNDLEGNM